MQDVNFWRLHGFFISFGAMNEAQWQKGKICSRKLFACTDNTVCRIHFFPTGAFVYIMSIPSVDEKEYKNIPQCLSWCGNVCVKRRSAICFVFLLCLNSLWHQVTVIKVQIKLPTKKKSNLDFSSSLISVLLHFK